MKIVVLTIILLFALGLGVAAYWQWVGSSMVTDVAPSPIATSIPDQAVTPLPSLSPAHPLITLHSPVDSSQITSPLFISGEARGNWFFEASFPVILTNWDGLIIAEGFAEAKGDWMTEEFVPFEAKLEFEKPEYGERGSLILQKSNPSGLPENADALEITIFFE